MTQFALVGPAHAQGHLAHVAGVTGRKWKISDLQFSIIPAALAIRASLRVKHCSKGGRNKVIGSDLIKTIKPERLQVFDDDLGCALVFANDLGGKKTVAERAHQPAGSDRNDGDCGHDFGQGSTLQKTFAAIQLH